MIRTTVNNRWKYSKSGNPQHIIEAKLDLLQKVLKEENEAENFRIFSRQLFMQLIFFLMGRGKGKTWRSYSHRDIVPHLLLLSPLTYKFLKHGHFCLLLFVPVSCQFFLLFSFPECIIVCQALRAWARSFRYQLQWYSHHPHTPLIIYHSLMFSLWSVTAMRGSVLCVSLLPVPGAWFVTQ